MKYELTVKLARNSNNEELRRHTFTRDSQKDIIDLLLDYANDRSLLMTHYVFEYKEVK